MLDPLDLLVSIIVYSLYGVILVLSIIFTFWLDSFRGIEKRVMEQIIPASVLTPLEIEIPTFSNWLYANHVFVGPSLILLSLLDIKFSFDLIKMLSLMRV